MALLDLLKPRVIEMGKIKIGGLGEARASKSGGTYRLPRKDDHFTITTLVRNKPVNGDLIPDDELMSALVAEGYADKHDGKLRQLPIMLLSDEMDDILQCAWVWYGGKTVYARSDGKRVTWLGDPKTMKPLKEPKEEDWKPEYADLLDPKGNNIFKLHTTFNCIIATGSQHSRWGGVYKFRTTSRISGDQLLGSLLFNADLTGGFLRGVPMRLVLKPVQVAPKGQVSTVYVVHVELRGVDLLSIQRQALQLAQTRVANKLKLLEYRRILTAPGSETSLAEIEDLQQEFQPEETPGANGQAGNGEASVTPEDPLLAGTIPAAEPENVEANGKPDNQDADASQDAEQLDRLILLIEDEARDRGMSNVDLRRFCQSKEVAAKGGIATLTTVQQAEKVLELIKAEELAGAR